jgi:ribosomal protein S18 acetylase RimI-like enzyme
LYATPDSSVLKRAIVYSLEWFASRFSDAELIQSPEDFDFLVRSHITPHKKIRLLGNGVDLDRFNPERGEVSRSRIREELGVDDHTIVVGMVGRLVAEKGVPELIEAAEHLGDEYVVVVVGPDDPEKSDALPRGLIRRGEAAGVQFLGMRTDVEDLYSGFDLFVLPSHREGFPRAAMEAAASGLPVVATDIRGCRQVVESGVNGFLFPVGDVDALTRSIIQVGEAKDEMEQMSRASVEKARNEFDEKEVVRIVVDSYREVASRKGLDWALLASPEDVSLRVANPADARSIAELHKRMITTGFLSQLGTPFLGLLYRSLIRSSGGAVFVAESGGVVGGFIAGVGSTGAFYKEFLRRHAVAAGLRLIPSLIRPSTVKRIFETLRHGKEEARADAELLSMAVAPVLRRRGLGVLLVERLQAWAADSGIDSMKVIVGAANDAAAGLYQRCGFDDGLLIEVHEGESSWEFVWSA